jgi:hypothetical protein
VAGYFETSAFWKFDGLGGTARTYMSFTDDLPPVGAPPSPPGSEFFVVALSRPLIGGDPERYSRELVRRASTQLLVQPTSVEQLNGDPGHFPPGSASAYQVVGQTSGVRYEARVWFGKGRAWLGMAPSFAMGRLEFFAGLQLLDVPPMN